MATQPRARGRVRSLDMAEGTPQVPVEVERLARTFFVENKAMNAAKKLADGSRKSLYALMLEKHIKTHRFTTTIPDGVDEATGKTRSKTVTLDVAIANGPNRVSIDTRKLRTLVDEDTFFKIISATAGAVEEVAGKNILVQVESSVPGTENVNVKAAK